MSNSFQHNNPSEPSVQQVKRIKRQTNPVDERVVATSHNE
jgi:hypothetical protein